MRIAFQPDNRIEGTEILTVQLSLTSPSQDTVNNAGNIFIRNTSTIRVIDRTGNYDCIKQDHPLVIDITILLRKETLFFAHKAPFTIKSLFFYLTTVNTDTYICTQKLLQMHNTECTLHCFAGYV